jgi:hypothetical protein
MFPLISDPFPLLPFLHIELHQAVEQQNLVDPVVRDMNSMNFFNFLFQMDGAQVVCVIGFENQFFRVRVKGLGASSWLFEYGIFLSFFVSPENLADSQLCYLKIPSDLCNWFPVQPLLDDSLNIPIG